MRVPEIWCKTVCKGKGIQEKDFYVLGQIHKEEKPNKMPPLSEMVNTFAKAMVRWAGHGFELVDRLEYFRRQSICSKCNERRKGRCKKCGCNLKMKLALATEKCPMNYWKET